MPDAPAQTLSDEAQVDALVVAQPSAVPAATESPASSPEITAATASVPFDLNTPEGARKALEDNEHLRNLAARLKADAANEAKQRLENEYRRNQATTERVQQVAQDMYERLGVQLDDSDISTLRSLTAANADAARLELMTHLAKQAQSMLQTPEEQAFLQDLIDRASGSPDEMEQVATRAIGAVTSVSKKQARDELSFDELVNDPRYKAQIDALVEQRLQEEARAQEVERQTAGRDPVPELPAGVAGAPSITPERLAAMNPTERLGYFQSLTDEQRSAMWGMVLGAP